MGGERCARPDVRRRFSLTPGRVRVMMLMMADAVCLMTVWFLTVRFFKVAGFGLLHTSDYLRIWPIFLCCLLLNMVSRTYHGNWMYPAMPLPPSEEFRRLFLVSVFSHTVLIGVSGGLKDGGGFLPWVPVCTGVLFAFFAQPARNLVRTFMSRTGIGQIPVALAGSGRSARQVDAALQNNPYIGFRIVLRFEEDDLRAIVPVCRRHDVKILLACQDERRFRAQLHEFADWFSYIEYMPQSETFPVLGAHAVSVDGVGGIEMMNQRRMKALMAEKRILDTLAAAVLFVVTLPFFIVLPVLIKMTSRGPVFYRTQRLGRNGRTISILKFRSMYEDADRRLQAMLDADPALKASFEKDFKLKNDPRVTPFGRFLRKTSLDELPQLFNVFRGDMALVGPRPIVEAEVAYYGESYAVMSHVKPGITGLWQCSGRSDTEYARRVSLDVYYVLNWSPWMDIWILYRTVWTVLCMRGAC